MISVVSPSPLTAVAQKLGRNWWALLVVGIAWIVLGFVVLRFDSSTVYVVSIVFGIMVLFTAAGEIFRATVTVGGWRVWHIVFAILLIVGAFITFANPGATFESLALVVGFYFVFVGTYDIVTSMFSVGVSPVWWLQLLAGIAEIGAAFTVRQLTQQTA